MEERHLSTILTYILYLAPHWNKKNIGRQCNDAFNLFSRNFYRLSTTLQAVMWWDAPAATGNNEVFNQGVLSYLQTNLVDEAHILLLKEHFRIIIISLNICFAR